MTRICTTYHRANTWIADHVSVWFMSMEAFWILVVLTWGSVLINRPVGAQGWDLFLVSIFYQGTALPALSFVSQKQGDRAARIAQETHDFAQQEFALLREELAEIHALRTTETETLALLRQMLADKEGMTDDPAPLE